MSDLRLEGTVFADLKKAFSTITDRMNAARSTLRGTDGSVVGDSELLNDVHEFADDWGYGVKQLGKHTEGAVKMIDKIDSTFSKGDLALAQSLEAARNPKKSGD